MIEAYTSPQTQTQQEVNSFIQAAYKAVGNEAMERLYNEFIFEALRYPARLFRTHAYLQENYSGAHADRHANTLLETLRPDSVLYMVAHGEDKPGKAFYSDVLKRLGTEQDELARAYLLGHFSRPGIALKQKDKAIQAEVIDYAVQTATAFAEAIYDETEVKTVKRAVEVLAENMDPDSRENNLFDCLNQAAKFAPRELAEKADIVLQALSLPMSMLLPGGAYGKYKQYVQTRSQTLRKSKVDLWDKKSPVIRKIWNSQPNDWLTNTPVFAFQKFFRDTLKAFAFNNNKKEGVRRIDYAKPHTSRLANQTTKRTAAFHGIQLAQEHIGHKVIVLPEGRFVFLYGPQTELTEEKTRVIAIEELRQYLSLPSAKKRTPNLEQDEMNAVLEYLRPGADDEEVRKSLTDLYPQVQSGLYAISRRGYSTHLRLPEEQYLRDMGFKRIAFKQVEDGIHVQMKVGLWNFDFFLDRSFKPVGLEQLTESNRNWLLMTSLVYLKSIKNPDQSKGITQEILDVSSVDDETAALDPDTEGEEMRSFSGKGPFLKVLPAGHKSHELGDPKIESEVLRNYGIRLTHLNTLFLQAQSDRNYFDSTEYDLQELGPSPESTILLVKELLKRIHSKVGKPEWTPQRVNGGHSDWLIPTDQWEGYSRNTDAYMVTFVPDTYVEDSKPVNIQCPGAAEEILQRGSPQG